jgi:adenine-specific DNA-methyltransferase
MDGEVRLQWEGKREAPRTSPSVSRLCRSEIYGAASDGEASSRLIQGDNLQVMAALREELAGRIDLIYLDPPFFTGQQWQAQATTGDISQALPAYTDDWDGNLGVYLQWMLDRLTVARDLLTEKGSLYVHLNWHVAHYVKILLDEIFGLDRFQNEIIWCYREAINSKRRWNRKHDTILFYTRGSSFTFNYDPVREPYAESHIKKYRMRDEKGPYRLMGRGIEGSPLRSRRDLPTQYELQYPELTYRHYLGTGTLPVDYWKIDIENQASTLRTGYPTQKPEALLERILLASTNSGDLVADFCCGSGTTLAVAEKLGRRWIGCDVGVLAIHTARKRLLEIEGIRGFVVEGVGSAVQAMQPREIQTHALSLCWPSGSTRQPSIRLSSEVAARVDMWAVQWRASQERSPFQEPFQPHWWSVRTRRNPGLEEISAPCPYPWLSEQQGSLCVRVVMTDAAGVTSWSDLELNLLPREKLFGRDP